MRKVWLGLVIALFVSSPAYADKKSKPPGKGFWKVLIQPNAKWVLHETIGDSPRTITIETYDVRKVAGADVARLRWTLTSADGKDKQDVGSNEEGRYTQLAVTPAGLYILWAAQDDAKVAAALKGKPSRSDPPKAYKGTKLNRGRYLDVNDDGTVCVGEGPMPDAGPCEDECDGTMCISPTDGIYKLMGNWAPGVSIFDSAP
jgi:hypothetical protein